MTTYQDHKDGNPLYFDGGRCYNVWVEIDFTHCSKLTLLADCKKVKRQQNECGSTSNKSGNDRLQHC